MKVFANDELATADIVIDAVYEGGSSGDSSDDALGKLLPGTGNQGGFRAAGRGEDKRFVALYTSGENKDWPDTIDLRACFERYFKRREGQADAA